MRFEDLHIGQTFDTEPVEITRDSILAFAAQFDPQPLHQDEEWARSGGPFGDLIASGIQTLAVGWASWVRLGILAKESQGGLGLEDVRFHHPVVAGDRLRTSSAITTLRRTAKQKGLFVLSCRILNQREEVVATFRSIGLLAANPVATAP